MTSKGRLIYKLITATTLILPVSIYLILSATIFAITPDVIIYGEIDDISVLTVGEGEYMLYSENTATSYSGLVIYDDSVSRHGVIVGMDDVVKVGRDYYTFREVDGVFGFHQISRSQLQKVESYRVPLAVMISMFGGFIAFLIIQKKMSWHKDHPRAAAFIALLTVTIILYIINLIVANMLGIFMVATVSWGLYCIEYLVKESKLSAVEAEKAENDITAALKKALGM